VQKRLNLRLGYELGLAQGIMN